MTKPNNEVESLDRLKSEPHLETITPDTSQLSRCSDTQDARQLGGHGDWAGPPPRVPSFHIRHLLQVPDSARCGGNFDVNFSNAMLQ